MREGRRKEGGREMGERGEEEGRKVGEGRAI